MPTATAKSARRTRVRLNNAQKQVLLRHHEEHPELSIRALCAWAAVEFRFAHPPAPSTLVLLFKGTAASSTKPTTKTKQPVASTQLEEEIVRWIDLCEKLRLPVVTGAAIRAKAAKIRASLMLDPTTSSPKLARMNFSIGWLQKLQQRHGMKSRRVHGEAASARASDVEAGRAELQRVTSKYNKKDVFNMDESAYFYCSVPTKTISKNCVAGRKKNKKRMTVAIAANADGSCKLPLFFIGTAARPRCFGSKSADELGVEYSSASKGWMTTALFQSWVEHFNSTMQSENRHVLLLLDNASPHRISKPLSNVTLHLLPPNTTAHLQPQDAGIISSFKSAIGELRNRHVVDKLDDLLLRVAADDEENIDKLVESLHNVDILTAMRWANEAWSSVTKSTIANCWRHTGILDSDIYELVDSIEKLCIAPL